MAEEYTIVELVEDTESVDVPCWTVYMERGSDNTLHAHMFPQEALEWRSAEYGIDDVDELLDIVLHEPFVPQLESAETQLRQQGRNAKVPNLFRADSTEEARTSHRADIARVKSNVARVVPAKKKGGGDVLEPIRQKPGIDPARRQAKREMVDVQRWVLKYGDLPLPPRSEKIEVNKNGN